MGGGRERGVGGREREREVEGGREVERWGGEEEYHLTPHIHVYVQVLGKHFACTRIVSTVLYSLKVQNV